MNKPTSTTIVKQQDTAISGKTRAISKFLNNQEFDPKSLPQLLKLSEQGYFDVLFKLVLNAFGKNSQLFTWVKAEEAMLQARSGKTDFAVARLEGCVRDNKQLIKEIKRHSLECQTRAAWKSLQLLGPHSGHHSIYPMQTFQRLLELEKENLSDLEGNQIATVSEESENTLSNQIRAIDRIVDIALAIRAQGLSMPVEEARSWTIWLNYATEILKPCQNLLQEQSYSNPVDRPLRVACSKGHAAYLLLSGALSASTTPDERMLSWICNAREESLLLRELPVALHFNERLLSLSVDQVFIETALVVGDGLSAEAARISAMEEGSKMQMELSRLKTDPGSSRLDFDLEVDKLMAQMRWLGQMKTRIQQARESSPQPARVQGSMILPHGDRRRIDRMVELRGKCSAEQQEQLFKDVLAYAGRTPRETSIYQHPHKPEQEDALLISWTLKSGSGDRVTHVHKVAEVVKLGKWYVVLDRYTGPLSADMGSRFDATSNQELIHMLRKTIFAPTSVADSRCYCQSQCDLMLDGNGTDAKILGMKLTVDTSNLDCNLTELEIESLQGALMSLSRRGAIQVFA